MAIASRLREISNPKHPIASVGARIAELGNPLCQSIGRSVLNSEASAFILSRLGSSVCVPTAIMQVRNTGPEHASRNTGFHQDGHYLGFEQDFVTVWISLVNGAGHSSPGIQIASENTDDILSSMMRPSLTGYNGPSIPSDIVFEKYNIIRPEFQLGDGLAFSPHAVHSTFISETMSKPRLSLEMRFFRQNEYPAKYKSLPVLEFSD